MLRIWKTGLAAVAIGVLAAVMAAPTGRDRSTGEFVTLGRAVGLQALEDFGVRQLFRLRGERKPPPQVTIVAANEEFIDGVDALSADSAWHECVQTAQKSLATRQLSMRKEVRPWPRCMQARLIEALVARGAAVIAFDIFFAPRGDSADSSGGVNSRGRLAAAMKKAGNIVLMHGLHRDVSCLGQRRGTACDGKEIVTERQIAPDPAFAHAALGVGQFVLPSEGENFTRFWPFKGFADAPSLSAVTLQAYADPTFGALARLIDTAGISWLTQTLALARQDAADVGLAEAMRRLRIRLVALTSAQGEASARHVYAQLERDLGDRNHRSSGERPEALTALLELYRGASERYIDFYGPPCTLPIYRGDRILLGAANPLVEHDACAKHADSLGTADPIAGKVVFVGVADLSAAGIADHYTTAFTRQDGVGLSGVEIAATTFANLLTNRTLRPTGALLTLGIFLGFGGLVGALAYALPWRWGFLATLAAAAAYGFAALMLFGHQDRWLPVAVPIGMQFPASVLLGAATTSMRLLSEKRAKEEARRAEEEARRAEEEARRREQEARRAEEEARRAEEEARRKFEAAMRAFRLYVPKEMAERLMRGDRSVDLRQHVLGAILTTDIKGFTRVSKEMDQIELTSMLDEYYDRITNPVERLGGVIASFSAGDRMMCAWPRLDAAQREMACRAALEVQAEIDDFNHQRKMQQKRELPTRIGLHAGPFTIGNVGSARRRLGFSFSGYGANCAERVEGLNKELKTRRVLASDAVIADLDATFFLRRIGAFQPRGMHELAIFEIMALRDERLSGLGDLCERYNRAIAEYEKEGWYEAARLFEAVLERWPADEPTLYFLARARAFVRNPPGGDEPWVVRLREE